MAEPTASNRADCGDHISFCIRNVIRRSRRASICRSSYRSRRICVYYLVGHLRWMPRLWRLPVCKHANGKSLSAADWLLHGFHVPGLLLLATRRSIRTPAMDGALHSVNDCIAVLRVRTSLAGEERLLVVASLRDCSGQHLRGMAQRGHLRQYRLGCQGLRLASSFPGRECQIDRAHAGGGSLGNVHPAAVEGKPLVRSNDCLGTYRHRSEESVRASQWTSGPHRMATARNLCVAGLYASSSCDLEDVATLRRSLHLH